MNQPRTGQSASIMISLQTAISRWAHRAFKADAEIDRLRAENAELRSALSVMHLSRLNEGYHPVPHIDTLGNSKPIPVPPNQGQEAQKSKEGE